MAKLCAMVSAASLPVWFLFITTSSLSLAENQDNNLSWSSELCEELGYGGQFDYCAELEFCRGRDDYDFDRRRHRDRRRRRHLRRRRDMEEEYSIEESVSDESEEKEGKEEDEDAEEYMNDAVEIVNNEDLMDEVDGEKVTKEIQEEERTDGGAFFDDFFFDDFDDDGGDDDGDGRAEFREARFGWRAPGRDAECSWPGPTIRMERGRSYGLVVSNPVEDAVTNLHAHGLHVAGHGNSNDATRRVRPGDVLVYNYTIQSHHMGGTFWYHAHAHPHTEEHVRGGAFGLLVVEDGDDVGTDDEGVRAFLRNERTLILSNNVGDGDDGYDRWVATTAPSDGDDSLYLDANEWYRLRVLMVNVDPNRDSEKLTFDGCDVRPIAHDGVLRFEVPAEERKTHVLSLSSRVDLAVRCGGGPSTDVRLDGNRVLTLEWSGNEGDPKISPFLASGDTWFSTRPPYLADLRDAVPDHRWRIRMGETDVNGRTYDARRPLCDERGRNFRYGSLEEWTVRTDSHPLHVHGRHLQIVDESSCGNAHDFGEYYDTVIADSRCRVRVLLTDVAGRTTLHCHVYRHGDGGSMGFFNVVGGPVQPNEPRTRECGDGATSSCDEPIEPLLCEGEYDEDEDEDEDGDYERARADDFFDDFF